MSEKIRIDPSPTADVGKTPITEEQLRQSTLVHITNVKRGMDLMTRMIRDAGLHHDYTKTEFMQEYYRYFKEYQRTGKLPDDNGCWFKKYHLLERHHLGDKVPDDVNLIDVIEMIVDSVMTGMARGKYEPRGFDPNVLVKAYDNTVDLLMDSIEMKKTAPLPPNPQNQEMHPANQPQQPQTDAPSVGTENFQFRL